MANYISISDIKASSIKRITTNEQELDWLYGVSRLDFTYQWGMPIGTISTWVGEGGVGKSRLAIAIAKAKVLEGSSVLYFQNEVDLPTLASWVNDNKLKNFYCSEVTSLSEQVEVIKQVAPKLVFVDSINLINEFGSGTAKSIKKIIDAFRKVIRGTVCHVVILCQLNKEGSATGSTALSHLPDTNLTLTNYNDDFKVSVGKKNRYGPKGSKFYGIWRHTDTGVQCISYNRHVDEKWRKAIGLSSFPGKKLDLPAFPGEKLDLSAFPRQEIPVVAPKKVYSPAVVKAYEMILNESG